jgi:hypothetical protein
VLTQAILDYADVFDFDRDLIYRSNEVPSVRSDGTLPFAAVGTASAPASKLSLKSMPMRKHVEHRRCFGIPRRNGADLVLGKIDPPPAGLSHAMLNDD